MTKYVDRLQPLALLAMRITLATVMIAHGSQKVFAGIAALPVPGFRDRLSSMDGVSFGGGILVLLGVLTRFAAFAITIDLLVAIVKVHVKSGLLGPGGFEFPLSVVALSFALIIFGAGPISVDSIFSGRPAIRR